MLSHHVIALPTPSEMAAWDRAAMDDYGLPEIMLMENASREAMDVLRLEYGDVRGALALIFAGPGNNGGDAIALARHLDNAGAHALVLHTKPKRLYKGAAGQHLRLAQAQGVDMHYLGGADPDALAGRFGLPDIVVDGLLGTGFSGELRGDMLNLVRTINLLGQCAFVLALDTPTGLDGLTGRACPLAVAADATVSFEEAKLGLAMPDAEPWVGALHAREIGIPEPVKQARPAGCALLTEAVYELMPEPDPAMHKGTAGHVLVAGGSPGLTGAPVLAALGALRGGAGLATVALPEGLCPEAKAGQPDVMALPLGQGNNGGRAWDADMAEELAASLAATPNRFGALALGPGLGRDKAAGEALAALLPGLRLPLVLDADALYWLAGQPDGVPGPDAVITPHPGEAARLLGVDTASVQADRLGAARALAASRGCVTVLKGAGTVIAEPDGRTLLSPFASPNLAVGGAGDVLAGLLASLLARGLAPLDASALAVYWHGHAGALLEEEYPLRGNLPRDIADALPRVPKEWLEDA